MDKNFIYNRQHIPSAVLNQNPIDIQQSLQNLLSDILPSLAGTVIGANSFSMTPQSPQYGVYIDPGIGYNSYFQRICFPSSDVSIAATPMSVSLSTATPLNPFPLSWKDNSLVDDTNAPNTTLYRLDIIYAEPSYVPTDSEVLDFLSATGSIFQQTVNQRLLDIASFNVAIGNQVFYASAPSPSTLYSTSATTVPSDALILAWIYNYPSATEIVSDVPATPTGSEAYIIPKTVVFNLVYP